jgi:hypothetical protein
MSAELRLDRSGFLILISKRSRMLESHPAFCCAAIAVWVRLSVLRTLADRDVRAPFCPNYFG